MNRHERIDEMILTMMAAKGSAGLSPAEIVAEFPDLTLEDVERSLERLIQKGATTYDADISKQAQEFDAIMAASQVQTQKADALMTPQITNDDAVFQALHEKYHEKADELERASNALKRNHSISAAKMVVTAARGVHAAAHELASYLEAITTNPELGFPGALDANLEALVEQGLLEKRVVNGVEQYRARRR